MDLNLTHCFVQVHDQDEALTFYRDVLGLEVRADVPFGDGYRWLAVGPARQPEVHIVLELVGLGRPPADLEPMRQMLAKGSLTGVIFGTDDLDATFEKLRAAGAEVLQEPMDQPYGRDCAFRDPSGNMIRFGSKPTGTTGSPS